MGDVTSIGEYMPLVGQGPASQLVVPAAQLGLASTVPAGGSIQSNVIPSEGFSNIAIAVLASQPGGVSVQRFLDSAGTIPMGAPVTASLDGVDMGTLSVNDGTIFRSFVITITNSSGAVAALSDLMVVQQS